MVIFHSYVILPEGRVCLGFTHPFGGAGFRWPIHSMASASLEGACEGLAHPHVPKDLLGSRAAG